MVRVIAPAVSCNDIIMENRPARTTPSAIPDYRRQRHVLQLLTLFALVVAPALGVLRIDLATGTLMVLGHAVNLRNFPAVAGLALVLATAPLVMVTTIGTLWCGWACPQNAVSEWATTLTHRWLGRRASVDIEGAGLRVAPSKNRLGNWARLALSFAGASLLLGLIPLFYFLAPGELWALATGADRQFRGFVARLYGVSAGLAFVDIALVRYFLCNYACLYRIGTLLFRNEHGLQVQYDALRAADCARCNACRVSCLTGVDPTAIGRYDRCINCGECIQACARLHARHEPAQAGLLRFAPGSGQGRRGGAALLARVGWHGLLFLAGMGLLAFGLPS